MAAVILGSGAFAREVFDWCTQSKVAVAGFFSDDRSQTSLRGLPIFHSVDELDAKHQWIIGIGSPKTMRILVNKVKSKISAHTAVIHPSCVIGSNVTIGAGSLICPGSIITCDVTIGSGVVINIGCTIGHDCTIGDFCHISPNTSLSGSAKVGSDCDVGTSVTFIPKASVADGSIVGAGAVVTKDLGPGLHVGIPAITKRTF